MVDSLSVLVRPAWFKGTREDFLRHVKNLLYSRRYGLPGCKKLAQRQLEALGVVINSRGA